MDWATLTRHQIEHDALPPVCMVCGQPAGCRVDKSFSHTPDWVGWLYWAGFFPGLIAEHFFTKEMRVSCPFCLRHKNHWSRLYWVAGLGWLVGPFMGAGLGFAAGLAFASPAEALPYITLGIGAGIGLLVWLVVLIYLATTRIDASKVTKDEITLQGVHDGFAKAVRDQSARAAVIGGAEGWVHR